MAQKDYVSRAKRGGQRKKTGKKKQTKTAKSSSGMLLLLVVIVAAFAGGLYFLKNNASVPIPTKPQTTPGNKQTASSIPPTPTKRWVYVDALVNPGVHSNVNGANSKNSGTAGMSQEQQRILSMMEADRPRSASNTPATYNQQVDRNSQNSQKPAQVTSPSAKATPAASQNWLLQCGSFRNKDGAESVKAQLAMAGISSQITFSDNLHRVIVGPYKTKEQASTIQTQIKNNGINSCHLRG